MDNNKKAEQKRDFDEDWAGPIARQLRYTQGLPPLEGEPPLSEFEKSQARALAQFIEEEDNAVRREKNARANKEDDDAATVVANIEATFDRSTEAAKMNNGKGPNPSG